VLDDRTARAYSLEGGLGDGFSLKPRPFISDNEDDLMIDDDVSALDDDDFEEEDEEDEEEE